MEIEKKFTIKELPFDLEGMDFLEIEQAYISHNPTIRIRRKNDEYILTIKIRSKEEEVKETLVNQETEFLLTKEEYDSLLLKTDGRLIKKKRYLLPLEDGKMAELDVFGGSLSGLIFVEVEFESLLEAESFLPPPWFFKDVSDDRRYRNTELSKLECFKEDLFL